MGKEVELIKKKQCLVNSERGGIAQDSTHSTKILGFCQPSSFCTRSCHCYLGPFPGPVLPRISSHSPCFIQSRNTRSMIMFGSSTITVVTALEFKFSRLLQWFPWSQGTLGNTGKTSRLRNSAPLPASKSTVHTPWMLC